MMPMLERHRSISHQTRNSGPCFARPSLLPKTYRESRNASWNKEAIVNPGTHRDSRNQSWINEPIVIPGIHRDSRQTVQKWNKICFLKLGPTIRPYGSASFVEAHNFWKNTLPKNKDLFSRFRDFQISTFGMFRSMDLGISFGHKSWNLVWNGSAWLDMSSY